MTWEIKQGHVLDVLRSMPDGCCQLICTSPPYYAQRNYKIADQIWGGRLDCSHQWGESLPAHHPGQVEQSKWSQAEGAGKGQTKGAGQFCVSCGAWRGQLGLEPTPTLFVEHLTIIFMECARVLRDDGLMFINIADSFAGGGKAGSNPEYKQRHVHMGRVQDISTYPSPPKIPPGLKAKSLIGIPWRLALALIDRGLILRNEISWIKGLSFLDSWAGAVMPSSARDRFTVSTESIFMFSKSPHYFFDMAGILEQGVFPAGTRAAKGSGTREGNRRPAEYAIYSGTRQPRSAWAIPTEPAKTGHYAQWPRKLAEKMIQCGTPDAGCCPQCGAGYRRVVERNNPSKDANTGEDMSGGAAITGNPQTSKGLHRNGGGVYSSITTTGWQPGCACGNNNSPPDDLEIIYTPTGKRAGIDPSMETGRAGMNRPRGDTEGTRPITRYEQRQYAVQLKKSPHREAMMEEAGGDTVFAHYLRSDRTGARPIPPGLLAAWIDRGWLNRIEPPTHNSPPPKPAIVLDPFCGTGTTLAVAEKMGRDSIGIELSSEYIAIAKEKIAKILAAPDKPKLKKAKREPVEQLSLLVE